MRVRKKLSIKYVFFTTNFLGDCMNSFFNKFKNNYISLENGEKEFVKILENIMDTKKGTYEETVILCIGTDRLTGDSLGPLVGHKLTRLTNLRVYGTLKNPVHALNLEKTVNEIYVMYKNPLVISIDACLGIRNNIGKITIKDGPLSPGSAVNKKLPSVGDISVTGIVNGGSSYDYTLLQNTRLSLVMEMAEFITRGLYTYFNGKKY